MSSPKSTKGNPDKIFPKFQKTCKLNGNARLNFLKMLTKLLNLTSDFKVPEEQNLSFLEQNLPSLKK